MQGALPGSGLNRVSVFCYGAALPGKRVDGAARIPPFSPRGGGFILHDQPPPNERALPTTHYNQTCPAGTFWLGVPLEEGRAPSNRYLWSGAILQVKSAPESKCLYGAAYARRGVTRNTSLTCSRVLDY